MRRLHFDAYLNLGRFRQVYFGACGLCDSASNLPLDLGRDVRE
jgi:hypothetical protein